MGTPMKVELELPPKLIDVFEGEADIRASWGGRGSSKTRTFAKMTAVRAYMWDMAGREGQILCGRQFMNSLADSSLEEIKAAIRSEPWLLEHFEIGEKYIRTKSGRVYYSFTGLDRNIDSVKSKARILLCWVDEAEPVTEQAWQVLIPTIREEGSELWVTWNPKNKRSPVESRFRFSESDRIKRAEINWRDNPWFPAKLNRDRLTDMEERPDSYAHIWEGAYVTLIEGSYYAKFIADAKRENRIGNVSADPLMTYRAIWDIGGTGAKADATSIWIAQFIGREIRFLNYYEAVGQPLATHVQWLRDNGYGNALCILPHDGVKHDSVYKVNYESALRQAGFEVRVIPNQGAGAATQRIEAARRLFPRMWFNEKRCQGGLDAIGWYHEKRDEERGIGLGPDHDWSSHGCFHPDTEVLTRYGTYRIKDLPKTGEVLTPCGWKQYIHPRITKKNAQLVEVAFAGGHTVKCTPDHLFLTASGWRSAESLAENSEIQSTLTKSPNILMVASTAFGLAKSIYREAAREFTEMFGGKHSVKFQKTATSIIKMGMCSTINLKTLSVYPHQSICQSHGLREPSLTMGGSLKQRETRPLNGILLQKEDSGTKETRSEVKAGLNGQELKSHANIVASLSKRLCGKVETLVSTAVKRVKSQHIESAAKRANIPLRIESVRKIDETCDVWDITVPDGHCFSLSNGAVVHNSDSFGLAAIVYEEPKVKADDWGFKARKVV